MFNHIVNSDIDYYLLKFLFIADIVKLKSVNRHLNKLITKTKIDQEMMQLIGVSKDKIMNECYKRGLLKILKNYHQNNKNIFIHNGLVTTSENGHIAILHWFKNSGFEFKYYNWAVNCASLNGHVSVLDWFKNSGFEFKYSENAINCASQNGHISVLDWFKNSGFEFKYGEYAINYASLNGHISVLDWFKNSGFEFKYGKMQ